MRTVTKIIILIYIIIILLFAGTNLKVWAHVRRESPENLLCRAFPLFFGSTSKICSFGERFRDGQYSSVSFLFAVLLLTVPHGVGATVGPTVNCNVLCFLLEIQSINQSMIFSDLSIKNTTRFTIDNM